ncbi:MAG: DoxX family membrane protein [Rhodobacteraceae bacterium]|nr:DoxX family membrane protein [Paracoccaceae bacterium]
MSTSVTERIILLLLRLSLGWVFLYAASHQVFAPGWSIAGFLQHTKTFHDLFAVFTGSAMAPVFSFLVAWGHLLIGLSLILGLAVRLSAPFGILLMILYWMAHMDFPYIGDKNSFIVDFHIVYALVLWLLIVRQAGHAWGLDAWAKNQDFITGNRFLNWATG